ncbi:hypothetical protein [Roseisalinus antarcticus]|uniref:Uncharacterized protein n=1 Tax=Roseisalinus antarcticus TaxID=254357 RepID=A0A1Y5RK26_9RHOB|nr:hypothetical protein [Roseisalinus antarcticus]SLN19378.1 hypothetical protein ROA7023_00451 [Roseisalinus antarcticus]
MLGFLIAIVAGYLTPAAEETAARPLARSMAAHVKVEPAEIKALAFMIVMLAAALLNAAFDSGTPFGLILGGALGYFATRIIAAIRKVVEGPKT